MMHIILTHEQADFDAIASLLGGYLLESSAIPVLPRKLNRNVRAFLTLYGANLPFVESRDLAAEPIDQITLVDTQSLTTLKGIHNQTRVRVIDHHPLRDDVPTDWNITISATGANTTLILELINKDDIHIDPIMATLFLLGIYEDTGSLTYSNTTGRDLQTAAYLLEQGASLTILSSFLNHPLSDEQKDVFDQLQKNVQTSLVHGYRIVISKTDIGDLDEELSTIVHKLRDIMDPDGLFVLFKTRGGVQFIARSTTDDINVAQITAHFGGGGHERAAAALIKDGQIDEIEKELKRILPQLIKPSITVSQLMSRDPQIVSPEIPVSQLAELMQRYGHEGFPVVDKTGHLLGLVTRRAVDRAVNHKLNLTAQQIMDVGEVIIYPDDSIEALHNVMTSSGWGQIPVVDKDSNEIIGIVTRTDLIKTLPLGGKATSRINLSSRLESTLPSVQVSLIKLVAERAYENRFALYIVGGFVRDLLLETPSVDFDLVVEGDAIRLAKQLSHQFGGRVISHHRFGTAKWRIYKQNEVLLKELDQHNLGHIIEVNHLPDTLDFVTARAEFYTHPTALPTVEPGSIKLDLHRRDFTINTLALRLDGKHYGELYDYWEGLSDLRKGLVRILHSLSFVDDPTRILRAVRFEQRFHFQIEDRTLQLLRDAVGMLSRVSGDRIRHELDLIFVEERVLDMLDRLQELDVLKVIHPQLNWDADMRLNAERLLQSVPSEYGFDININSPTVRRMLIYQVLFSRLSSEEMHQIVRRLHLPSKYKKMIGEMYSLWEQKEKLVTGAMADIVNALDGLDKLSVYVFMIIMNEKELVQKIRDYYEKWSTLNIYTDGTILKKMGIQPGPIYGKILFELRTAWIEGKVRSELEEKKYLEEILQRLQGKKDGE